MPLNDYNDPELTFPRLQARIQLIDNESYWLHVWLWDKPGGPRKELMNGKRAGNANDAHEYLRKFAAFNSARIGPDDIAVEAPEISN
jgi:hypothetical protein